GTELRPYRASRSGLQDGIGTKLGLKRRSAAGDGALQGGGVRGVDRSIDDREGEATITASGELQDSGSLYPRAGRESVARKQRFQRRREPLIASGQRAPRVDQEQAAGRGNHREERPQRRGGIERAQLDRRIALGVVRRLDAPAQAKRRPTLNVELV